MTLWSPHGKSSPTAIARLHERLDGHDLPTCTDAAQLRRYLNRLPCAPSQRYVRGLKGVAHHSVYQVADLHRGAGRARRRGC